MLQLGKRFINAAFTLLLCAFSWQAAHAQTPPPEIALGTSWLQSQIQGDGSLTNESTSIALPLQVRSETLTTFQTLGTAFPSSALPSSILSALAAGIDNAVDPGMVEPLARQAIAHQQTQTSDAAAITGMMAQRNSDNSFGATAGFIGNPLDTAWFLIALGQSASYDSSVASTVLSYLQQSKLADGSWSLDGTGAVYTTALAGQAASVWGTRFQVGTISTSSQNWLLAHRNANQEFGNTFDNAYALLTLSKQTSQTAVLQPIADALIAAQLPNGSWDNDPYLTALALRALFAATQTPSAPTTGDIQGKVIDYNTGSAIANANVSLVERSQSSADTANDGSFALSGIPEGTYTLRVAALGYQSVQTTITVTAGQLLNLGAIRLTAAPLTASLSGVVKNSSGTALANVIVAVGVNSALTSSTGAYLITGLDVGPATITASLTNYQTATADVTFEAGKSYVFSPTLYSTSQTPPTTSLKGKVVNSSGAALANVTVTLGDGSQTPPQTTVAAGTFQFDNLTVGPIQLTLTASGYQTAVLGGTLVTGVNDVGNIVLTPMPVNSALSGTVTDVVSGAPIANATVAVQGQTISAMSDINGHYTLSGIDSTDFTLLISATGYLSQTLQVHLSQPGDGTLDIQLAQPAQSGITIESATPDKTSYKPNDEVSITVGVLNASGAPVALLLSAQVFDDQHNLVFEIKANASGGIQDRPNLPLVFPNGTLQNIEIEQLLFRQAAGNYTVHVLAADGGGLVLAERDCAFTVEAMPILTGGVDPNPPLAQIDAQQPIQITADLTNVGNQPVPSGSLDLRIVLENPDTQTSTMPRVVISPDATFASGAPLTNARGLVADDQGNLYTMNVTDYKLLQIAVDGTMSVIATLPSGITANDLARDRDGNFWITSSSGIRLYEVTPAGVVTAYPLTTLNTMSSIDVAADGSLMIAGTFNITSVGTISRLIKRDAAGVETVLWSSGLSNPVSLVKDDNGNYVVTNYNDNTLTKVAADGSITPFVSGLNRPQGVTRDAAGNFYVANSGDGTIVKVSPQGTISTYATGFNQPMDLKFDGNGNLFVSNQGDNSILKVLPDGTVQVFAQGIANNPQGMKYDTARNLWIANTGDGTLRMKNPQDEVTVVATGLSGPRGLALTTSGDILIANYSGGSVVRVSNGGKSNFATGLTSPYGVAVGGNGEVYVTETGANRISRFDGDGNPLGTIETILYNPSAVRVGVNGEVYVANNNFITVVENGVSRKLVSGFTANYIAPDPVNGGLVAVSNTRTVYRIADDGTRATVATVAFNPYGVGVDADGNILLADYNGKQIVKLDSSGTVSTFATLSTNPYGLVTDLNGRATVRYSNNVLARIESDGTESPLTLSVSGVVSYLGVGADGKLRVVINSSGYKAYSIDRDTGVATLSATLTTTQPTDLAGDAAGGVFVTYSSTHDLKYYDNSGILQSTLSGFVSPSDIVWDGSVFWFADNSAHLYKLAPGGYPVKQTDTFATWLAINNGTLFGTSGATIYQWDGSARQTWTTLSGLSLTGIAVRADGALTVGDTASSRVVTVDSSKNVIADYAGLIRPMGLAFDAQGRLHVANYGGYTVVRFDGLTPSTLARPGCALQYLAFDDAGTLWATSSSTTLCKIAPDGTTATLTGSNVFYGLLLDGNQWVFVDRANSQLRRYDGANWTLFATGLNNPQGVRVLPNGDVAIASRGNNSIVRYSNNGGNGGLTTVANNLAGLNKLGVDASGRIYTAADGGIVSVADADGGVVDLHVNLTVNNQNLYGVALKADGSGLYTLSPNTVFYFAIEQTATVPPAAGTVVYQASLPMAALPPIDQYDDFDFGSWLPPYGGDFRIEVSRAGVEGVATNFVHVGGAATSTLVALKDQLPPGDQTLPMCMNLSGADFTSISRVEAGQVRKLVTSGWPSGMAADRAGNLYYTSPTALNRVTPAGINTVVVSGLSTAFGLAADSNENFYLPSKNSSTGNFELIKVDLAGNKTVVADLGVTSANGVQVDSHDDILVGSPNKLLKVNKNTGAVSVASTFGLPQPRGLAIDINDNVYVQNENHYVSMIRPDGSAVPIFSRGDGTVDPYFEGDGFPNITGDCGGNFYIATYTWARIGQSGEEHTLAQVVPRTGDVVLMFDTSKISPNLNDIDYISYDRFSRRILMFNDSNAIWQAPVTCGAIGVDVHLLAKPGQDLSGASRTANAVIPRADGRTEYVWSLQNVTADGEQICFDASEQNLQLGELRKTLDSGYMSFQNSFAAGDVQVPIDIPNVLVTNLIGLTVATDAADYPANSTALVTTTLNNTDALRTIGGMLNVQVFDSNDVLVGGVTQQGVTLLPGDTLPITAPFAIGAIVPAQYTVKAVLDDNGLALAQATTTFNVLGDNQSASAISALSVDRLEYNPSDQVIIASRAQSRSANMILDNLTLMVKVFDEQGAQIYSHGHSVDTLLPGALRDFTATETLSNVPAGTYTVTQDLLDSSLRVLDQNQTTYLVGKTSATGFGLTGVIAAVPNSLRVGETVTLGATVTNQGNSDIANLPLTIYIIDPDLGNIVTQFDQTSNIAQGGSVPFNTSWATSGRVGATYLAVLAATIGSGASATIIPLAQDSFTLLAQIAAGITATGGTPQSETINETYPVMLEATVLNTVFQPVPNVTVTFTAPTLGASVTFPSGSTAVTDINGKARVNVIANSTVGAFNVTATAPGVVGTAVFQLENKDALAASITATGGTPQTAEPNTTFGETLQATVLDSQNNPMPNIVVTFAASAGSGIIFPNGSTAVTNANGQAEIVAAAGNAEGNATVSATAPSVNGTANFYLNVRQLRNLNGVPIPLLPPPQLLLLILLVLLMGVAWKYASLVRRRRMGRASAKPIAANTTHKI
ncbi:MAG: carboxypeptidase regulatory-like domain-containing protein [Betaproteobacteria bacterium]|nr:carboxypeptidase regulatory-like domain-containing protein [Betaproteobacteria bacterium]